MTRLLVSVKDVDEAMLAMGESIGMIDIKDPTIGALGALDLNVTKQIISVVNGQATVSATVGEGHETVDMLVRDILARHTLGVDVIKLAFSELFKMPGFSAEILKLTKQKIKLVMVLFAEDNINLNLLPSLKKIGFYGVMIDTKQKQQSLTAKQTVVFLHQFVLACRENTLLSGLAGSLKKEHLNELLNINPGFIGFRGGVCDNFLRQTALSSHKLHALNNLLLINNEGYRKAGKRSLLALHT